VVFLNFPGGTEEDHENSLSVASAQAEIQTAHLSTSQVLLLHQRTVSDVIRVVSETALFSVMTYKFVCQC
jgi:hypothetical protein